MPVKNVLDTDTKPKGISNTQKQKEFEDRQKQKKKKKTVMVDSDPLSYVDKDKYNTKQLDKEKLDQYKDPLSYEKKSTRERPRNVSNVVDAEKQAISEKQRADYTQTSRAINENRDDISKLSNDELTKKKEEIQHSTARVQANSTVSGGDIDYTTSRQVQKENENAIKEIDARIALNNDIAKFEEKGYKVEDLYTFDKDGNGTFRDLKAESESLKGENKELQKQIDNLIDYESKSPNNPEVVALQNKIDANNAQLDKLGELSKYQESVGAKATLDYYKQEGDKESVSELSDVYEHLDDSWLSRQIKGVGKTLVDIASTALSLADMTQDGFYHTIADVSDYMATARMQAKDGNLSDEELEKFNEIFAKNEELRNRYDSMDPDLASVQLKEYSNRLAEEISFGANRDIQLDNGWTINGDVANFIGQGIASSSNFLIQYALLGPTGSLISMSGQSATDTYFQLMSTLDENGNPVYTQEQCFSNAIMHGLLSYGTEAIGMDSFVDILTGGSAELAVGHVLSYVVKSIVQQGMSEGAEELVEGFIGPIIDAIQLGTPIEYNGGELLMSFLLGAFSGVLMGAGGTIVSGVNFHIETSRQMNQIRQEVEIAKLLVSESQARIDELNKEIKYRKSARKLEALNTKLNAEVENLNALNRMIETGNMAINGFVEQSPISSAVQTQQDSNIVTTTQEEAVNNLTNALLPDVRNDLKIKGEIGYIINAIDSASTAMLELHGVNMDAHQFVNELTPEERAQVRKDFKTFKNAFKNANVRFDNHIETNDPNDIINGYYDYNTKELVINPKNANGVATAVVAVHEYLHSIEDTDNYGAIVETIFSNADGVFDSEMLKAELDKLANGDYSEFAKDYYGNNLLLKEKAITALTHEAVANKISESFLNKDGTVNKQGATDFLNHLAKYNTSGLYKFMYNMKGIKESLLNSKEYSKLNQINKVVRLMTRATSLTDVVYTPDGFAYEKNKGPCIQQCVNIWKDVGTYIAKGNGKKVEPDANVHRRLHTFQKAYDYKGGMVQKSGLNLKYPVVMDRFHTSTCFMDEGDVGYRTDLIDYGDGNKTQIAFEQKYIAPFSQKYYDKKALNILTNDGIHYVSKYSAPTLIPEIDNAIACFGITENFDSQTKLLYVLDMTDKNGDPCVLVVEKAGSKNYKGELRKREISVALKGEEYGESFTDVANVIKTVFGVERKTTHKLSEDTMKFVASNPKLRKILNITKPYGKPYSPYATFSGIEKYTNNGKYVLKSFSDYKFRDADGNLPLELSNALKSNDTKTIGKYIAKRTDSLRDISRRISKGEEVDGFFQVEDRAISSTKLKDIYDISKKGIDKGLGRVTAEVETDASQETKPVSYAKKKIQTNAELDYKHSQLCDEFDSLRQNGASKDELTFKLIEIAKSRGFGSPLLYHGGRVGFTAIDPSKLSEYGFFTTTSLRVAKGYSGGEGMVKISDGQGLFNIDETLPLNEFVDELNAYNESVLGEYSNNFSVADEDTIDMEINNCAWSLNVEIENALNYKKELAEYEYDKYIDGNGDFLKGDFINNVFDVLSKNVNYYSFFGQDMYYPVEMFREYFPPTFDDLQSVHYNLAKDYVPSQLLKEYVNSQDLTEEQEMAISDVLWDSAYIEGEKAERFFEKNKFANFDINELENLYNIFANISYREIKADGGWIDLEEHYNRKSKEGTASSNIKKYLKSPAVSDFLNYVSDIVGEHLYGDGLIYSEESNSLKTKEQILSENVKPDFVNGVIPLVAKSDNMLVVECNGCQWFAIPVLEGIPRSLLGDSEGNASTDEYVEYVKRYTNYDGVIFKNIYDNAGFVNAKSDVYAYCNYDVIKSLDVETYSNTGEYIDVRDRFDVDIPEELKKYEGLVHSKTKNAQKNAKINREQAKVQEQARRANTNEEQTVFDEARDFSKASQRYQNIMLENSKNIAEYGAITDHGGEPNVYVQYKNSHGKTSLFADTLINNAEAKSDYMLMKLMEAVNSGEFAYETLTNEKLFNNAWKSLEEDINSFKGDSELTKSLGIESRVVSKWMAETNDGPLHVAKGAILYAELVGQGRTNLALEVAEVMAEQGRDNARSLQALAYLKVLTPEGRVRAVEKEVARINRKLKMKNKNPTCNVSEDAKTELREAVRSGDSERIAKAEERVQKEMVESVPPTIFDKIDSWRYIAMLGNLKTVERNIIGNTASTMMASIKDKVKVGLESIVEKGVNNGLIKINDNFERTSAILNRTTDANLLDFANKFGKDYIQKQAGSGKYEHTDELRHSNFKEGSALNKVEGAVTWLMNNEYFGDTAFVQARFKNVLAQYMKSHGMDENVDVGSIEFRRGVEYAWKEAERTAFHEYNALAEWIDNGADRNRLIKFLRASVIPFTKTPMNVARQSFNYTALGGIYHAIADFKKINNPNSEYTINDYCDYLAQGMTGSMIMAIGWLLASKGLFRTNDDDEDRLNNYQKDIFGEQDYSIKIGDITYTIDWLTPSVLPLSFGAELHDLFTSIDEEVSIDSILNLASTILDPMAETTMLSSLIDTLNATRNGSPTEILGAELQAMVNNYINQMIPTLVGQIKRGLVNTRYTTYPNKGPFDKALKTISNKTGLPFGNLQHYLNVKGEQVKQNPTDNTLVNLAYQTLSPGYISKDVSTDTDKEIVRLYESTGNASVLPQNKTKEYTNDKEKTKLYDGDYTSYNEQKLSEANKEVEKFINSDEYKNMSDDERAGIIEKIRKYSGMDATATAVENSGKQYNKSEYLNAKEAKDNGINLSDYYSTRDYYNGLSTKKGDHPKNDYIAYLNNSDMSDSQKVHMYGLEYGDSKSYKAISETGWDDKTKMSVFEIMANTEAIKDSSGKSISNSKASQIRDKYVELGIYDEIVALCDRSEDDDITYQTFGLTKSVVSGKGYKNYSSGGSSSKKSSSKSSSKSTSKVSVKSGGAPSRASAKLSNPLGGAFQNFYNETLANRRKAVNAVKASDDNRNRYYSEDDLY